MDDPTDSGLAIGGICILGLSLLCCVSFVLRDTCCKRFNSKPQSLLNDGVLSEVTVE